MQHSTIKNHLAYDIKQKVIRLIPSKKMSETLGGFAFLFYLCIVITFEAEDLKPKRRGGT